MDTIVCLRNSIVPQEFTSDREYQVAVVQDQKIAS